MPTTLNIISPSNTFYRFNSNYQELSPTGYSHNWSISGGTMSIVAEKYIHPIQYSLKVQPLSDVSNVVLTLNNITYADAEFLNDGFQFHARYFSISALNISTSIHNDQTNVTETYVNTSRPSQWSTGYSQVINAGGVSISFDVVITISNHAGNIFYLSLPTLISDDSFFRNAFVKNLRRNIPSFIWDKDSLEEYPTYPFYKLFHALTSRANDAAQYFSNLYEFPADEIPPGYTGEEFWTKSVLVNPDSVYPDFVPWLSQFTGSKIKRAINVDGSDILAANSVDADEFVLWQLENSYFGWGAGSVEALRESVKQLLSGQKIVYVFPGGSNFTINIYTLLTETPGVVSNGDTSDEIVAIAQLAKPLGFDIVHAAYTSLPFLLGDEVYGLLDVAALG